jgi:hypothetical protein
VTTVTVSLFSRRDAAFSIPKTAGTPNSPVAGSALKVDDRAERSSSRFAC